MEAKDRRTFNRLVVSLLFSWRSLSTDLEGENLPTLAAAADNPFSSWFMDLRPPCPPSSGENDELSVYYRKFSDYLEIVERKISLISQIIFQPPMQHFFQQQPVDLTLSATGLSFPAAEPLAVGTRVLLTFFLPHAARLVTLQAHVLRVVMRENQNPEQAYLIAAQFMNLDQDTEDEIARFIILSERKQLRQSSRHHDEKA